MAGVQIPAWALLEILNRKISALHASIVFVLTFVLVIVLYVAPTGTFVMSTGTIFSVSDAVVSEERFNTGDILLAPVSFYGRAFSPPNVHPLDASPIIRVRAFFDPHAQVHPLPDLVGNSTPQQYRRQQAATQLHAQLVPLAVALGHAGMNYSLRAQGVLVTEVVSGSPSEGILQANDVITHVNNAPLHSLEQLLAEIRQSNETITLTTRRSAESQEVVIPVVDERIGIRAQAYNVTLDYDAPISIELGDVTGSSADVLIALEALSILTQTDITQGRIISGSGTLSADGSVRAIRGADLKALVAQRAGATLFFLPEENEEIDVEGLTIVRVSSFSDVVDYLSSAT